jgi:hypothetical protein
MKLTPGTIFYIRRGVFHGDVAVIVSFTRSGVLFATMKGRLYSRLPCWMFDYTTLIS